MSREKLEKHNHEVPAEMAKAGRRTVHSEIHKAINSIWNKQELTEE
jgi:hypothetical protein